jgi:hypothetical protein
MTAARSGSPLLCSPQRVKCARLTDPGYLSCSEFKGVDFLVTAASGALRLELQEEGKRMRVGEWAKRGGFGALACALCDSTPASHRACFPLHRGCEFREGCHGCDLDFYSVFSEKTGRTLTLCEFCFQGEWTRFGRRVFEVVRPAQLFLVDCAESLIWRCEQFGGRMLRDALGQGFRMVQSSMPWADDIDIGEWAENPLLRGRVLGEAFSDEFDAPHRRRLKEEGGVLVGGRSEGPGDPSLV